MALLGTTCQKMEKKTLYFFFFVLQIYGLHGLETSDSGQQPKVIVQWSCFAAFWLPFLNKSCIRKQLVWCGILLMPIILQVLGLRLVQVDGKNFYTEDGIVSLETGSTASIQVVSGNLIRLLGLIAWIIKVLGVGISDRSKIRLSTAQLEVQRDIISNFRSQWHHLKSVVRPHKAVM